MNETNGEHPLGDIGQIIALFVFMVVWTSDSFYFNLSTFLSNTVPVIIRLPVTLLLLTPVYYLIKSGHQVINHENRPDHVVITGAFHYIRHPLYLASLLTYLALTISTLSVLSLIVWIGIFLFHNYIATFEEKLLEVKMGESYREYKQRIGKWIPHLAPGAGL